MHHIYHTEGLILGSKNFGEAEKIFYIFTKELGMISASAQGVRKISSKLRFVLQDFTYLKIDLVRGRDCWRITSGSKVNKLEDLIKKFETFKVFNNIVNLLKRLLAGEEKNENLFLDLIAGLLILEKAKSLEEIQNAEIIIVLRILNNLGYIGKMEGLQNLIHSPLEKELIFEVNENRLKILSEINKALRETQL